jgi:putative lipoprotein
MLKVAALVAQASVALGACAAAPPPYEPSPMLGRYEARGQEPGWLAEMDPARGLALTLDYGERRLTTPPPAVEADGPGRTAYVAVAGQTPVRLVAVERPCADVMSGRRYPHTVELQVGERRYDGCGGPVTE